MDGPEAAEHLRAQLPHLRGRSPLYERLVAGLAGAAERGFDGGVIPRLLTVPGPSDVGESRLLLLAALHHAALADPGLPHAAWFPTAAPDRPTRSPAEGAPSALALAYLVEHEEAVTRFLAEHRLQTNEVGRIAALLPGVLRAAAFGLPLRLLELGTSAGLNLRLDRFRVRYANGPSWGPTGGPVLDSRAEGRVPRSLVPPTLEVAERRGVDLTPLDPSDPDDVRLLHAFVWADERDRHDRLHDAIEVAASVPAAVDAGDLVRWAGDHGRPRPGTTTVLFHSQVRHLIGREAAADLADTVESSLRAATAESPFVYLGFERPRGMPDDGTTWPELTVATSDGSGPPAWSTLVSADWHGRWVRWF